jgi:crotonobetainyl-CoA:carnitine CoA-transferase CaiB-like acyl-CoA transferase
MTSISPFGQDGPYGEYKGSNLVAEAMGGLMYITGNPDGRPLSTCFTYAYIHGGLQAATATLVANYWRQSTGQGQHVDVSLQEAVLVTLYNPQTLWSDSKVIQKRLGGKLLRHQNIVGGLVLPCKDGYVLWRLMTADFAPRLIPLVEWMDKEGMAGELTGIDWKEFDMSKITQEQQNEIEHIFARFFLTKTKSELYVNAVKKGVMLFPVYDVTDVLQDPQLEARHFWQEIDHGELGIILKYAGVPFKISGSSFKMKRAPYAGEHNRQIYCKELGIPDEELTSLKRDNII